MAEFDERSGVVECKTPWGCWYQTVDEIVAEVTLEPGTKAKEIKCKLSGKKLTAVVRGKEIVNGTVAGNVVTDDFLWTVEDNKLLRIVITKSDRTGRDCWQSLLQGQYPADPQVYDNMEKKLTMERVQRENPGLNFADAEITGNYHGGGPQWDT
ncbi:PREDICTED: nudC domain-containing protein 2-like isoform X2 [Branchiostoma belcheri]|uniref:NudC domain-containing protein 2-like isoform X2 n=1 Tax=Branchiostoma belcheri TaxID=7741 RepID=A0A6P5AME0_BRABE|nr:PREDICTED: nudC domain-containing protein 2-like isoform X2 [Branchiostoma belcheri]